MTVRSRTFVAVAAFAAAAGALHAQPPIRIGTIAPDNTVYVRALREMCDAWRKATQRRVACTVFPGGDATENQLLRDMQPTFRRLDAAQLSAITLGNLDSAFNVFGLPMFFESYAEADRVLEALAPELEKRLEAKGYKALYFAYVGWVHVFSTKPVKTLDDLKGLKLYTSTGDDRLVRWYSANGFKPVPLEATEMLTSLQTNMIEAVPSPPLFAQLLTWYKSAPYMMDLGFAPLMGATVMSLESWKRVPAEHATVLLDEAKRAGERLRRDVPRMDKEAIEAMRKTGLTVTTVDKAEWRTAAEKLGEAMREAGVVPGDIYDVARRERDSARAKK